MNDFITKEFKTSSAEAWKQKINFDLKGADYNETLLTNTVEGIVIKPFYHQDNFEKLIIPKFKDDFSICQKIQDSSEKNANSKALNAIENGANAIKFSFESSFDYKLLLKDLLKKNIEFHFEFSFLLEKFIEELSVFLKDEIVFYNIDIIGNLAKTGNWYKSLSSDFEVITNLLENENSKCLLSVNVDVYQNAGANCVQQVVYAVAHANEYLNKFGKNIAERIQFNFAIGNNYFFEIAKIRAFRYLMDVIFSEYQTNVPIQIYAEPSLKNKSIYDYNVNMLRSTTECMSGILGGANTISNISYDCLFHNSNDFGERISRNQLLILKEESYFVNAQNISTNSYYIESITKQIAEKALSIFKNIEKSGGFLVQLKEGTVQRKINEIAKKEQSLFDEGKLVLIGANKYPNSLDKMKNDIEVSPFLKSNPKKTLLTPMLPKRLAEKLEKTRLNDEA